MLEVASVTAGYVMALGSIVHEIGVGEWQSFLKDERLVKAYLG